MDWVNEIELADDGLAGTTREVYSALRMKKIRNLVPLSQSLMNKGILYVSLLFEVINNTLQKEYLSKNDI